jgi:hypothetical protein
MSVDILRGDAMFSRLQEAGVMPYNLVVFDESHKLVADRESDLRLRKTERGNTVLWKNARVKKITPPDYSETG